MTNKSNQTEFYHIAVASYNRDYWLQIEVPTGAMLKNLDDVLRRVWLECCGHLSNFEIEGTRYESDSKVANDTSFGARSRGMRVTVDRVLEPGMKFTHEYDYGSTTYLELKVIGGYTRSSDGFGSKLPALAGDIRILARNDPPTICCSSCDKPATGVCTVCIWDDEGWLCEACAEEHECGEDMLLPLVNSPRTGVCGYDGELDPDNPDSATVGA